MSHQDNIKLSFHGHLKMTEYDDQDALLAGNGTIVMNRRNAVDRENAALMFARALADQPFHTIYYMAFGNGGATVDPLGNVVLNPPVVNGGISADLYNPLFNVVVDDQVGVSAGTVITTGTGSETYKHTAGTDFTDVIISAVIGKNEPFGYLQYPVGSPELGAVIFNEIGLKLQDGKLITHVTFTPIVKKTSTILQILYTIRISLDVTNSVLQPPTNSRLGGQQAVSQVGSFTVDSEGGTIFFVAVGASS